MEGASTSAVTGSHRASFNAAYTTLEQSIRNFSKEKLMYEQTIEGLNEQIALVKESFQRLNLEHQDLMAENQRLMTIQDENEKTRHGVDALIASVERKQEIIQDTVYGFESIEQDFLSRYDAHEEFLYCLKYRQIQLVQCFEEANKQNESLRMSLGDVEKKYQFATQQLSEAKLQTEENSANFLEEKSRLIDEYQGIIDELKKDLLNCNSNLQLEKNTLKEMEAALSNVQDCLESTLTELKETKELMQLKMYSFAEEKESLRQTHEETVNDLTKRLEELNMSMIEKVSCFGEEKSKLISDHLDAISKVQTDLQLKSEELQVEKQEYEKIKAILVDVQAKYESTSSELTSTKELMNKTIVSFENEKAVLTSNNKQTVDDVTKQLTDLRILLEENSASFTKEKLALVTQHDEAIAAARLDLEVCKEELQIEKTNRNEVQNALNELQGKYDSTMKQLADVKEEMAAKVSSHTKERELLISDHKEAMESLEQEYKQCKAELQAMHTRLVEQKKAISKLVDETNSRPIILPSSKDPKKGVRPPISASQDRLEVPPMVYKPLNRSTPSTPGRPRISAPVVLGVESPKSRGILKRPSDGTIGEKSKNVSFGPTYVTDFHISSSSDTETSSGEVYRPTKDPNVGKRMRLTKSKKDKDVNEEFEEPEEYERPVQQGKETKEKQQRRFFRNNVTIPKGSAVNSQSAS